MIDEITLTGAPWTTEPGAIVFIPDATEGWTVDEAYAFLARDNPSVVTGETEDEFVESLVAAADVHEGAMIAFIPSDADLERLALPDGEDAEQLHITAFYLGDAVDIPEDQRAEIIDAVAARFEGESLLRASVFGFGTFNPDGEEPCVIANVGGGDLEDAHELVGEMLDELAVAYPEQHDPWIPHITLIYATDPYEYLNDDLNSRAGPIVIDRVRVAFAGEAVDIPLGNLAASGEAFHMPGGHDQLSHGGGGGFDERVANARTGSNALNAAPKHFTSDNMGTAEHGAAVAAYAQHDHEDINSGLRRNRGSTDGLDSESHHTVKELDAAISESKLTDDVVVYRGMSGHRAFSSEDWTNEPGKMVGVEFTDHGFSSTTTSRAVADEFTYSYTGSAVMMKILVPKGMGAIAIDTGESELLLARGTKFRIVGDSQGEDARLFNVEVIQWR